LFAVAGATRGRHRDRFDEDGVTAQGETAAADPHGRSARAAPPGQSAGLRLDLTKLAIETRPFEVIAVLAAAIT
jgi:hypothetical protein